jgi:hypothetical protein
MTMDYLVLQEVIGYELVDVSVVEKLADERVVLENGERYDADGADIELTEFDEVAVFRHPKTGHVVLLHEGGTLDATHVGRRVPRGGSGPHESTE